MFASSSPIRFTLHIGACSSRLRKQQPHTPRLSCRSRVANELAKATDVALETTIASGSGVSVATARSLNHLASAQSTYVAQSISVANPQLWSPEAPHLYRAVTRVIQRGKVVDEVATMFGIRSLAWSTAGGLELNGKPIKLHGGSVHADNGLLGAAAFDRAEERKVELLKGAGNNAVRTAHNPPSPAFLDACDRLGLFVLEDSFDVWRTPKVKYDYARFFDKWWQRDLDSMVLRDRNHPSVIMSGIGNEIPEAWTPAGAPIAKKLSDEIRSLDSTRPITEAFPGATYTSDTDAVFAELDIGGYNYNLAANHAEGSRACSQSHHGDHRVLSFRRSRGNGNSFTTIHTSSGNSSGHRWITWANLESVHGGKAPPNRLPRPSRWTAS